MKLKMLLVMMVAALLIPAGAMALSLGNNITISDQNVGTGSWYDEANGEDQEVEPGMVKAQAWDLEGFFLDGSTLSLVGGYNFSAGKDGYTSGDIFIDVDGDAEFGDIHGAYPDSVRPPVNDTFGYDYVFDLDFDSKTYDLVDIRGYGVSTNTVYFDENHGSNPWTLESGGVVLLSNGGFDFYSGLKDSDVGFSGGSHYAISGFDLSGIDGGMPSSFIASYTMECGNDNVIGSVPEPSMLLLMGTGLIGLAGVCRRQFFN